MSRIRQFPPHTSATALRPLRPFIVHWLTAGIALVLLLPAARSYNLWIGWLPYWLVAAPLLCLAIVDGLPKLLAAKSKRARASGANALASRRTRVPRQLNRRFLRQPTKAMQNRRARLAALISNFS